MRKGMREEDEGGDEEYGGDMRREGVRGKEWLGRRGEGRGVRDNGLGTAFFSVQNLFRSFPF